MHITKQDLQCICFVLRKKLTNHKSSNVKSLSTFYQIGSRRVFAVAANFSLSMHVAEWGGWMLESEAVIFSFFPFFLSGSRGCSWKTMLERTFGRLNECGWRLRCSQILSCGCLLSHKGGGRIQHVFLKLDWLQIADVFTFFIMYITVVLNSAIFFPLQTVHGQVHWWCLHLSEVYTFLFFSFAFLLLLRYFPP